MSFKNVLFWCEFPYNTEWNSLNLLLKQSNLKIKVYVAVKTIKEFNEIRKKKLSNIKIVGAWPTLPFNEGYWFSGHASMNSINKLDQFKKVDLKLDLEPPIPNSRNKFKVIYEVARFFYKKGKNNRYLKNKIKYLSRQSNVVLSTFPLPKFLLKRIGFLQSKNLRYNFFYYSTMVPWLLRPVYKLYFKYFLKKQNKDNFFALGLIGPGIFRNEPIYKNLNQFKKDVKFFQKNKVKNLVLFELSYLTKRENPEEWVKYIKSISLR